MRAKDLGQFGENVACDYLENNGYKILERNFRSVIGEIDIIAKDGEVLVFIEVKTKSNFDFGLPQEMVTNKKQHKLIKVAYSYLKEKSLENIPWRIDVVAITKDKDGRNSIELIKNAVGL
jgi:putative endonuclease